MLSRDSCFRILRGNATTAITRTIGSMYGSYPTDFVFFIANCEHYSIRRLKPVPCSSHPESRTFPVPEIVSSPAEHETGEYLNRIYRIQYTIRTR